MLIQPKQQAKKRYTLTELLQVPNDVQVQSKEDREWLDAPSLGARINMKQGDI